MRVYTLYPANTSIFPQFSNQSGEYFSSSPALLLSL
jgi:hypothetical protein